MIGFTGQFDELRAVLARLGYEGEWSTIENGHQFRARDGAKLNWFPRNGTLQCQGKREIRARLESQLQAELDAPASVATSDIRPSTVREAGQDRLKVFVVHGHDVTAREQLELILHRLDLDPFVLANTGGGGLTIIEALEAELGPGPGRSRFGIVLMTPDDMGYAKADGPDKVQPRARQNVVLEMGMLISRLGRPNVAILKKGHLDVPSDAHGILYLGFNDHVKETVPRLVDRLRAAGFQIDPTAITRASA
jgi:predicted nucleotide-binding protein